MNNVGSDEIIWFEEWRLANVKLLTCRNYMRAVKNFIQFCGIIQAVPVGLHELVEPTKVSKYDEICDNVLTREEATAILDHPGKYEYASLRHVVLLLLWKCGIRIGGLRVLDVEYFDEARPAVEIRHRPETGTPLKRKENSERDIIIITPEAADVVRDYIKTKRPDSTDDYRRKELIATEYGRASRTIITKYVYIATQPCSYNGGGCPFDRDPDTCEANYWGYASKCPGSVSPHALRRGYVTAARNAGQPNNMTGKRVNITRTTTASTGWLWRRAARSSFTRRRPSRSPQRRLG